MRWFVCVVHHNDNSFWLTFIFINSIKLADCPDDAVQKNNMLKSRHRILFIFFTVHDKARKTP